MKISVDISFYPFTEKVIEEVESFLERLRHYNSLSYKINFLSTQIAGNYNDVMEFLQKEIYSSFENGKSMFVIKITNAYENPEHEIKRDF